MLTFDEVVLAALGEMEDVLDELGRLLQDRLLGLGPEAKVLEGAEKEALPLLPLRPWYTNVVIF